MTTRVGWARRDIGIEARGFAMNGYGMAHHKARGQRTPLFARALFVAADEGPPLVLCLLDLAMVNAAIRTGMVAALADEWGDGFDEAALVVACTHTHSSPGGCAHEALYNLVTPGFVPDHLEKVVAAGVAAVLAARDDAAPTDLSVGSGTFAADVAVAWNRSLDAYNANPDVETRDALDTHLALDRTMAVIAARRDDRLAALVSFFGVHATCLGSGLDLHDGDNKGYAAAHAEEALAAAGEPAPVAIFAQGTAGDVSPHYQGPGDIERRAALTGDREVAYAQANGRAQAEHALTVAGAAADPLDGPVDAVLTFVDFSRQDADPRFTGGVEGAETADPCHGIAFFAGTRVDGVGVTGPIVSLVRWSSRLVRRLRLSRWSRRSAAERDYYRRLYAAQDPKDVLLEAGRKRVLGRPFGRLPLPAFVDPTLRELRHQDDRGALRESPLVPTVLPLQIVRLGPLALVGAPGEFTTVAGRRIVDTVAEVLAPHGIDHVVLCTYCNDYMGYVTTAEEYATQHYEGGHTIFGRWTQAAFQTRFAELAGQLTRPPGERTHDTTTRPPEPDRAELALRTRTTPEE